MHSNYDEDKSTEENTLVFVNRYRTKRELPSLAELPGPARDAEHPAARSRLANALDFHVFRNREANVFTDLDDEDTVRALHELGCANTPYRPNRIDNSRRFDVRLPWYTWEFAA